MPEPHIHARSIEDGRTLKPGDVVDRYVVEGVIGAGGTATVYRVRHRDLGTTYALKVLELFSAALRRRILQEGRVQATMRHRNVVGVFDVLEVGNAPGLLMEFVHGPSLESAMARHRFSPEHADLIFRGIVAGVRTAHEHGLVHRDLKPANVLLAESSDGLVPKVTDFGIAKVVGPDEPGHTRAGVAMGTPQYMAPEQIRDAKGVDLRADVFSLGCILYELCTGHRAFPQDDILKVYNAICEGTFVAPRQHVADLPDRVSNAIIGALATERDERIPDCATLMDVYDGRRVWSVEEPTELLDQAEVAELVGQDTFLPADLLDDAAPDDTTTGPGTGGDDTLAPATERAPRSTAPAHLRRAAAVFAMLGTVMFTLLFVVLPRGAAPEGAPVTGPAAEAVPPAPGVAAAPDPVVEEAPPVVREAVAAAPPTPAPRAAPVPRDRTPDGDAVVDLGEPPPRTEALVTRTATSAKSAPPAPATVRLLTLPRNAAVYVDGVSGGVTPYKGELPPGRHTVRVVSGDQEGTFTLTVAPGADARWCYVFAESRVIEGSCPR